MVPYDIGSGPEMSCPTCEWCWGADGQDLKPLDVTLALPTLGGDDVELRLPLLDQHRTMGRPGRPGVSLVGHALIIEGPIAYPGGKDGMYRADCSCGQYTSDFDTKAHVTERGEAHIAAKTNGGIQGVRA